MSLDANRKAISAVIPVRNGEIYIQNCFKQVQENLSEIDEAIFVVNGSSDGSFKLLKQLSGDDVRIRVLSIGDMGLVSALNMGIHESSNNWIARFDVDDVYDPNRLNSQRKLISDSTAVIFSDYKIIGTLNQDLGYIPSAINHLPTVVSLFGRNRTAHPSALFSKKIFIEAGMYQSRDVAVEDLSLWLRMCRYGDFRTVPLPLLTYLLHGNSVTSKNRSQALSNSLELLKSIGVPNGTLEKAIQSADEIVTMYDGVNHASARSFLFLHNLNQFSQILQPPGNYRKEVKRILAKKILNPSLLLATLQLGRDSIGRQKYRRECEIN
jgi:hypothetical protein